MKNIIFPTLLILLASSCTKVIDVDLNTTNPQYVIQSVLFAGTNDFEVDIKQTTSYFNPETPPVVENATVTLYDYNNIAYPLVHSEKSVYKLSAFTAEVNKRYKLVVSVDGKLFEAETVIPGSVSILYSEIQDVVFELDPTLTTYTGVYFEYQDPANIANYYQIEQSLNSDELVNTASEIRDDYSEDGQILSSFSTPNLPFESGDTIWTELRSIDAISYQYFNEVRSAINAGGGGDIEAPTTANPKTNWTIGALGYFGAGNSDLSMVIVP